MDTKATPLSLSLSQKRKKTNKNETNITSITNTLRTKIALSTTTLYIYTQASLNIYRKFEKSKMIFSECFH